MARGIYFSGDLAAMNDAMASEERNRIAGRTANQSFLSNLASQATTRRGQDVTERVSNRQMDTDRSIASERAGILGREVDNNYQAALAANAMRGRAIQVEADKITAAERAGQLVDAREKDRINRLFQDNEAQRRAMVAIALINANATQGSVNPRMAQDIFNANFEIETGNQAAAAAAEVATRGLRQSEKGRLKTKAGEIPNQEEALSYLAGLPMEQQSMLTVTNNPAKPGDGFFFVPRIRPSISPNLPARDNSLLALIPQLIGLSNAAPSVATPPIAPRSGPGDSMNPRLVTPARTPSRQRNVIPIQDIFRGVRTNAVETPANRMEQPVFEPGVADPNEVDIQALLQLLQSR